MADLLGHFGRLLYFVWCDVVLSGCMNFLGLNCYMIGGSALAGFCPVGVFEGEYFQRVSC
jgi:hypothetical protein